MRFLRVLAPFAAIGVLSGCGYVHFGRLPIAKSDPALDHAITDLTIQQKILKQELVLAHKEADALRVALERAGGSETPSATTRQLEDVTRELAALRVSYARLQAERTPAAAADSTSANLASLQDENSKLRRELEQSRTENASMAEKLKASVAETEQAHLALAQLNTDLLAQKEARERAEQATAALRTQLEAVMARAGRADSAADAGPPPASTPAPVATAAPSTLSALRDAKAPPSGAAPTVDLRTNQTRARAAALSAASSTPVTETPTARSSSPSPEPPPVTVSPSVTIEPAASPAPSPAAPAPTPQTYTVQVGDTLEKISIRFYGAADHWSKIYDANSEALSSSQGLKAGMTLRIP